MCIRVRCLLSMQRAFIPAAELGETFPSLTEGISVDTSEEECSSNSNVDQLRIGSWSCGRPGTCSLLLFSFFSHFWDIFLAGAFLHLSVTPTLCITNDGKYHYCLCIYICFCLMSESARDINFKEDFSPVFTRL